MCDITLSNISFGYGDEAMLSDMSLAIAAGDFLTIVGPNGSGKSTVLKLMAGLLKPWHGQVKISGQEVEEACRQALVRYVPQNYGRNTGGFPATVEEIVGLGLVSGASKTAITKSAAKHIIDHMLDLVGVTSLRQRRIGELSGGQQQRVMVAMALAGNPRLLLLDEPTSGIDYEASAKIYELLGMLNKNLGITVVMVSHDLEQATLCAKKVVCINRGICYYGDSAEFRADHAQIHNLWHYSGYTSR